MPPKSHRAPQVIFSAVSVLALWYNSDRVRFLAFTVFYGVLAGGYNALFPTTISEIYGIQNYASVNSALYFVRGIGVLCGAPIAGVILGSHQSRGSNSSPSQSIFVGVFSVGIAADVLLTTLLCIALHTSRSGLRG